MNDHDHPLSPERRLVLLRGFLALGAGSLASCGGGTSAAEAAAPPTAADASTPTPAPTPAREAPLPAPPSGAGLVSVSLSAANSGNHGFAFGHMFRQGDLRASSSLQGLQLTVFSTWPDGSAKFALVAGAASFAANVATAATLVVGTAPSGSALVTADLKATGIAATLAAGSFGSVSWAGTDWDAPHRTWATGPVMSSWLYRKPVGSDPTLVAWLEVRLWSTGQVEVLPWVENGYVSVGGPLQTNKSATYTFALGGSQRFSAAIDLPARARTPLLSGQQLSHWLGTDPGMVVRHDAAYLMSTRTVPNYTQAVPDANLRTTAGFTPLEQGLYPNGMGQPGYHASIGLLPDWDAAYLVNASAAPWKEVQRQAYRAGRFGIHFRDETTLKPAKLSSYPNTVFHNQNSLQAGASTTNSYSANSSGTAAAPYAFSHHPSTGFMAALITGRCYHVETCQFVASLPLLTMQDIQRNYGSGRYRTWSHLQVRGMAWSLRSVAQAIAVTPDSDSLQAEYRAHIDETVSFNHARYVAQASNPLGFMDMVNPGGADENGVATGGSYTGTNQNPYADARWMHDFVVGAVGYVRGLTGDIGANQSKLIGWFEWLAKSVVGRFGGTGATEYLYRDAGAAYVICLAPKLACNWGNGSGPWYANWGECWADTWQAPKPGNAEIWSMTKDATAPLVKELGDGSLRLGYIGSVGSYWHNMLPALSYCVEYGVSGASDAWSRLTGAPNYTSGIVTPLALSAEWGVFPRAQAAQSARVVPPIQPALPVPAWVPSVPGQAVRYTAGGGVLTNNFRDVAAPWMSAYYDTGIVDDYSGAVVFERLGSHGALVFVGGGHSATNSNQVTALTSSPTQLSFVRLSNPTAWSGSMASDQSTQSANSTGASLLPLVDPQWIDATPQVSAERAPPGIHSYAGGVALPSPGALGAYFCPTVPAAGVANLNTPLLTGGGAHTFAVDSASDPAANKWERAGSLPGYSSTGFQGPLLSAYVPTQGRVYYFIGNSGNKVRWFDLASGQHVEGSVNGFVMSDYNTGQVLYVPGRELLLYVCRNRSAQVEVQWMDVSVASPQQGGTAVLGQALDLDPFEVGKTSAWVASFWCPLSQRLNLGGVMVGGAFDAAMYEVEIPSALRSSWPVVRRPITGSANIDWGVWTWQQPMYVPAARAMILFQVANKAAGTADSVIVYRPYGT